MKIYLVGGAVRDKLLGYPYHEHDWVVVGARAQDLLDQGFEPVGKDFPVFLHPKTKEEYALARTERKTGPGYTGFDCFTSTDVTLEEDLLRRDLTINAIAEDSEHNLIDPFHGQQDIHNKVLRHVSPAFTEDPLRVLRVARFAARYAHLGFSIASETMALMQQISASDELQSLPAERIWKELERALTERDPQQFFITLDQAGALKKLMPALHSLTPKQYAVLKQAASQQQASVICFAVLFSEIDTATTEQCCQQIRCPKNFRDLAILVSRFAQQCQTNFSNANTIVTLLDHLDPYRRPQRFEHFLSCCELLFADDDSIIATQQLRSALACCQTISAADLAAEGLTGKAIGKALQQRRHQAVNELLFNSTD
ncbi:MAG: multifunctional CCA tRNA nucleotidyl transferase/2'3'-cyclic phosphodiesterase/2'nucleotidase/phosphatase [Spongiibacteraceae bacterium]